VGYSKEGCKSKDTVCVQVIDLFDLILPNIITPNGDSENDIWDASVLPDFNKFTLQVYDRQGLSVNVMKQYQNNFHGQDFNGNDLPVGIYYYRFFNPENDMEFKGYIQIIRYF
jgi:gliding motility-associated-like protein